MSVFLIHSAYGEILEGTADLEDGYYYTGEYMDTETGLYYLRARYMNPATATFTSMDSYAGNIYDPASLHRYLYANANPVKYTDPSGHKSLLRVMTAVCIKVILAGVAMACVMAELGGLVGAVSTAVQGGNTEQVVNAFMNGFKSGALLGAYLGMLSGFVAYCCSVSLIKASAFVVFGHDTSKALTELLFDGDLIKFAKQLPIIFMDYIFYRAACTSEPINLLPGYEGRKETLGNIFKKISESTGGSSTGKVPGRVQSRINIAKGQTRYTPLDKNGNVIDAGWNHVVKRHFNGELSQGTSKFTITQDELKKILQSDNTVSATVKSLDDGQFVRTVDTGQIIGNTSLKYGGGPTSWIKVFTDKAGNIITTYPIPEP